MNPPPEHVPIRSIRIPDAIWRRARARAAIEGTTVSAVIVEFLEKYAEGEERDSTGEERS